MSCEGDKPTVETPKKVEEKIMQEKKNDDHPFFHYYGLLPHQQNMLQDLNRTGTYQKAISSNEIDFKDKVVLDVGTGTGILAAFAAQAGAKTVYAVEASDMAENCKKLMEANKLDGVIKVIKGKIEEIELPEKVDMIISEPMGFILVHERMLESYMHARKWLKEEGKMFPTCGKIYFTPFTDEGLYNEQLSKVQFWNQSNFYGLDMSSLVPAAADDHFSQPVVGYFDPNCLLTNDLAEHDISFLKDDIKSLHEFTVEHEWTIEKTALMHGIACWFDVDFEGSAEKVKLCTGPSSPATHWYQARLMFKKPVAVNASQKIKAKLHFVANKSSSYYIHCEADLVGTGITVKNTINLQDQYYHYLSSPVSAVSHGGYNDDVAAGAPESQQYNNFGQGW
eukprot:TRINITY_DN774164_c0_g1_i1.p1 TRINITY_DN774164_c0_g1~~TRINITY_DN774164_c0_g1_i1.p1  ORF type:complete len:394 (-),score=115.84 TRINITY_DN774164_c0_g1_i1:126-1307(-)